MVMLPANLFANTLIPLASADGHLLDLAPLMLGCLVTIALGAALGRLACRWTGKTDAGRATTMLACCCANSGAIPMLLMQSLCSDASTALHGTAGCAPPEGYPALFSIAMNVCFWTWGVNVCKMAEQGADDGDEAASIPLTVASERIILNGLRKAVGHDEQMRVDSIIREKQLDLHRARSKRPPVSAHIRGRYAC